MTVIHLVCGGGRPGYHNMSATGTGNMQLRPLLLLATASITSAAAIKPVVERDVAVPPVSSGAPALRTDASAQQALFQAPF
ncbi:hypothetical protein V499_04265 [Pseudogymnoascus sp. VKM F-103]|nr:hypothetical protein V499_04265 [Pseudogymnoascus sp. VKM F-103]